MRRAINPPTPPPSEQMFRVWWSNKLCRSKQRPRFKRSNLRLGEILHFGALLFLALHSVKREITR